MEHPLLRMKTHILLFNNANPSAVLSSCGRKLHRHNSSICNITTQYSTIVVQTWQCLMCPNWRQTMASILQKLISLHIERQSPSNIAKRFAFDFESQIIFEIFVSIGFIYHKTYSNHHWKSVDIEAYILYKLQPEKNLKI